MIYCIIASIALYAWWRWRADYRRFQKMYNIKLPFLCVVTLTDEKDKILRGTKRRRFITKRGGRDHRYSMNFKITYPTIIVVNKFKLKIWDLLRANKIFTYLEPYMDLPLDSIPFKGPIEGDPMQFFNNSQTVFIRYCGKLMCFYGWECALTGRADCHIVARYGKQLYAVHCILRRNPVVLNDLIRVSKYRYNMDWIVMTNSKFSNGAKEFGFKNKILMVDGDGLRRTMLHEELMFL